ncbi:MAG: TetR/AcrR family transcriptional regulator [Pseudomonadales bacterium]
MNKPANVKQNENAKVTVQPHSRGDKRRRRIFRSLHDCIIQQGYVKTTLADIAKGAKMSPSHLLYYFKGKEAILEQYFDNISIQFTAQLDSFKEESFEQRIDLLANFWFRDESTTMSEIGFMFECFGAAVNDEVLRGTKAGFDAHCKSFLADLFKDAPTVFLNSPKDAAEISYSLMMGLRSAVYFDDDIDLVDAHRLFSTSLRTMAGIV